MVIFAIIGLIGTVLFPHFVQNPWRKEEVSSRYTLSIRQAWMLSNVLFFFFSFSASFSNGLESRIAVALCGASWAITQWAPLTIISAEIAASTSSRAIDDPDGPNHTATIHALHNCAIAIPQILAALGSSVLFYIFQMLGVQDHIGWLLRLSSFFALLAAYHARGTYLVTEDDKDF
jgi:solute carrier family 45 protein 1/2/4